MAFALALARLQLEAGPGPRIGTFEGILPAPFDGLFGTFVIALAAWIGISALLAVVVLPLARYVAGKTPTDLDKHLVGIVGKPVFVGAVAYGVVDATRAFALPPWLTNVLDGAWGLLLVVLITYTVYRIWHEVILSVGKAVSARTESTVDDKLYPFFNKVGGVIIVIAGMFFMADAVGINPTLFAAGGAVVSLVVAFAAQDTLSNFFAGVQLLLDQPFREGDRIEIQELETWGDVQDIGLRTTRIITRDNRTVIIPNAVIASNAVVNHSFPDTRYRIATNVGIAYGSDIEKARAVMLEAVQQVPDLITSERFEALFVGFGDSSLDFLVRGWFPSYVDTRRYLDKLNTELERALANAGIEIPFPQRDLHIRTGALEAAA